MKNNKRKEEILELILEQKNGNYGRIYQLITSGVLDNTIDKINDKNTSAIKNTFVKKGYFTSNEQFIDCISNFMYYYDRELAPLDHKDLNLEYILQTQTPQFLLCKKYWGDNNFIAYYQYSMKYTIIYNFYENLNFIYNTLDSNILKEAGITKFMDLKDNDDVEKIFIFIKKLIWCNIGDYSLPYLFHNYKYLKKEFSDNYPNKTENEIINMLFEQYSFQYKVLLSGYRKKIKYVNELL